MPEKTQKTMELLIKILNEATLYYDKGEPIMSDAEWDYLYYELCSLECETGQILPESPTHFINFEVKSDLDKITHDHLMLSLDKTKSVDAVRSFLGNREWVAMAKMDGLTCSLTYENGELVRAETRGNGEVGEDITHNMRVNLSIPQKISYMKKLTIDGEIICDYANFKRYEGVYKNPRNLAAGSIRLLDSWESRQRMLQFVAWDVIDFVDDVKHTLIDQLEAIKEFGFIIVPRKYDLSVEDAISKIKEDCELLGFPIDGIVFKFNDLNLRESLGYTAHHFNNAIAYKFFDELYETNLRDIEWGMGRTGVLTPVAVFDPVDADGSIVEKASLHNISVMESLLNAPYVGQKLHIFKANQIIPQIEWAEDQEVGNIVQFIPIPQKCPVCGMSTTIKDNDGVRVLYCTNPNCEGKLINRLDHYLGKKGLDAKGISKATLEKLLSWDWVYDLSSLYILHTYRNEWMNKPGFGEKSVDKILNSIYEASHDIPWEKFLCALGIPLIGENVCKDLSKIFKSWDGFRQAVNNGYKFYDLPNFGWEKHNSIIKFDYSQADNLVELKQVTFAAPAQTIAEAPAANSLTGKIFVITGSLKTYKNRAELQAKIESLGGKVTGSISKNTSYLINNDVNSTSSKNLAAQKLSIPIISEFDFNEMIS